jgi:hypothetical protein
MLLAAVCLCAVLRTQAQPMAKTMLMEPPAPLLPATLGKLQRVAEGDSGDGLGQVDLADKPVLTEDGLKRFARSEYTQGSTHGSVTAYQFMDVSGALAAYDYWTKPGMRAEKMGDNASSDANELLMQSGVNVVVERFGFGHDETVALTNELIDHLPKAHGPAAIAPLLPSLLPAKGLDAESVRYALGPAGYQATGGALPAQALGFEKSGEAVTARYKSGGVLTVLLYPTPEIAGEVARAIPAAAKQQGPAAGTVVLRREGPLVAVTTGAWPAAAAQAMVESVHLPSEVTFDKPMPVEFHAEIRKTYSLLESIAIFSGVGALAAITLGLFLGFGRAGIRVLMGKPAATEPEFLRIDLRGVAGKRLRMPKG